MPNSAILYIAGSAVRSSFLLCFVTWKVTHGKEAIEGIYIYWFLLCLSALHSFADEVRDLVRDRMEPTTSRTF